MATVYHNIIRSFPQGYCLAFAYGSGVFRQLGQKSTSNMMDFVFAVNDPFDWHKRNIKLNPKHYSALRFLGAPVVDYVQNYGGAKMYYNTLVPTHAGLIKYGVISRNALIADLLDWKTMYVAGRLHKPVMMLHRDPEDSELLKALRMNLFAALHTSLLLLPESFTEEQLWTTIAELSYAGDFRMGIGEDANKVANIVGAQAAEFRQLYRPLVDSMRECVAVDWNTGQCRQDGSPTAKYKHLSMLPMQLQMELVKECNRDDRTRDLEEVLKAAANDPDAEDMVFDGVSNIVQVPSMSQALKGVLTAGLFKAVRYSLAKVNKMIKSRTKR